MRKIIVFVLLTSLWYINSVFALNDSSFVSNVIKIQDNFWKILHQYSLESNSDGSLILNFDWNNKKLKEKPFFYFLENWDYFIYYKEDNVYIINYNWKIILSSFDTKLDKIFDGEENLFSKNHFIRISQKKW